MNFMLHLLVYPALPVWHGGEKSGDNLGGIAGYYF